MPSEIRFASGLHVFGSTADRYVLSGYKPAVPVDQMIKDAAKVPDLEGIELVETWHINKENAQQILSALKQAGLKLTMLIPDLWATGKWGKGSFTSRDKKVRHDAVQTVKRAMDMAALTGCNLVDVWLGQDGFDYPFQGDFLTAWEQMVECLQECADHNRDVIVGMEYKVKEPRTHCYISGIGKQILLFEKVDRPNLGVILDVGHALAAYENMAESVAMCKTFGQNLVHLHLNDNWRSWDDDMMVGGVHTIELLELLCWLERVDYRGWYSLDIFPYRDDGIGSATQSIAWIKDLRKVMFRIGLDNVEKVIAAGDAVQATKMVRQGMLGSKD